MKNQVAFILTLKKELKHCNVNKYLPKYNKNLERGLIKNIISTYSIATY